MLFNSLTFLVFFIILFSVYVLLRKQFRLQNLLILVGSYIFYGWWDERFLILVAISTTADYLAGLGMRDEKISSWHVIKSLAFIVVLSVGLSIHDWENNWVVLVGGLSSVLLSSLIVYGFNRFHAEKRRKAFLLVSILFNLGILGFFKYFNFFAESLSDMAAVFGVELNYVTLNIVLPVGISFYTFQTMSYAIDVYYRRIEPTTHFLEHAAFVSFFPQLVAGPIERASHLLPQFMRPRNITLENLKSGATLFIWGLYKKIVIADNLAPISDRIFANPGAHSAGEILVGVLAFTFQIFCDFSGYSDMARGIARMLGFELMVNFNLPYFARTPSEFWRRWHISLSTWLRDYLYFPLGGNRKGKWKTYRNLSITMFLGGLWHGAAWTFIVWGIFHGLILIIYRTLNLDDYIIKANRVGINAVVINFTAWLAMFVLTMIAWVFFRAQSLSDVFLVYKGLMAGNSYITPMWSELLFYLWPLIVIQGLQAVKGKLEIFQEIPVFVRVNFALFALMGFLVISASGNHEFLYFDF